MRPRMSLGSSTTREAAPGSTRHLPPPGLQDGSVDTNRNSTYFQHAAALVESANVGARTRIWAFAHVLPGAIIGEDCNICDHVFIENDVKVGNRVTVKCGVQLWDGL